MPSIKNALFSGIPIYHALKTTLTGDFAVYSLIQGGHIVKIWENTPLFVPKGFNTQKLRTLGRRLYSPYPV
jgi:hypothetical protein